MIPIKNIYYMLSYAFNELHKKGYEQLAHEEFRNIYELYAEILVQGINKQIKRGIEQIYHDHTEQISTIRGKLNITDSILPLVKQKQVICQYDEYTTNSYKNKIIKTTIHELLKTDINTKRRKKLKKLLVYFTEVDLLDKHNINWQHNYNKNNKTYQMLINICYLVITGLLQRQTRGTNKLITLDEDNMSRLYEKFILEYYKKEHPELRPRASHIPWQTDNNNMLPRMKSDTTLTKEENTLIIDAKYYKKTLQEHYQKKTIHSQNLYQIFTYVKNKKAQPGQENRNISGMILYAKTDEDEYPDNTYNLSGNTITVKTLDLNQDFMGIKKQLEQIIMEFL